VPERPFQQSELYKMHAVVIALDRVAQQLLEPFAITYTEFLVMLSASEGSDRTQSDIGRQMALGKASISIKVKALLEKKLVVQRQNEHNRRENFLSLTDKGEEVLSSAIERLSAAAEPAFEAMGENRAAFREGLDTLMSALYRGGGGQGPDAPGGTPG
jgi:DNA-binding MarR family transcriptional regulator